MFQLHDLKERQQEAWKAGWIAGWMEGWKEGLEEGRELAKSGHVKRLRAKGNLLKEIAEILEIPLADVRRFARSK